MTSFTAVYDACVLYPAPLRDLLIRLAEKQLFRARWTEKIHDEWISNLLENRPELMMERLAQTRERMNQAVPDCLVTGYEELIPALQLPDPDDRHVLAAAIRCNASVIVTFNQRDFPANVLAPYGVEIQSPDVFLLHLLDLHPAQVYLALREQRGALRNPVVGPAALLHTLEQQGLPQSVLRLRDATDLI